VARPSSARRPSLVPADRSLYACATAPAQLKAQASSAPPSSARKLAEGLDALVLDVKTGSGAFLRQSGNDAEYLAALMVATAEAAGTRTVALLTDMDQPLGRAAGNWIEIMECLELLARQQTNGERRPARAFSHPRRMDDPSGPSVSDREAGYAAPKR